MELLRLNQHEENDKKTKGITLKASSSIQEESDKEIDLDEDDDLSLFVKRFNKFRKSEEVKGDQILNLKEGQKTHLLLQNALNAINLDI